MRGREGLDFCLPLAKISPEPMALSVNYNAARTASQLVGSQRLQ